MKLGTTAFALTACMAVIALSITQTVAQTGKPNKPAKPGKSAFVRDVAEFTKKYCYRCHSGQEPADGFEIPWPVTEAEAKGKYKGIYQKAARYCGRKIMPPKIAAQPKDAERKAFLDWIAKNCK